MKSILAIAAIISAFAGNAIADATAIVAPVTPGQSAGKYIRTDDAKIDVKVEPTDSQKKETVKKIVYNHLLFEIGRDNPDQAKKLEALSKQDPAAFAKTMDEYAQKSSQYRKQKTEEFRKLVEEYLLNPSEQIKTEIKTRLAEVYDRKISWEKGVIARQEEQIKARRDKLKKIEVDRETLIDEQFEKITQSKW